MKEKNVLITGVSRGIGKAIKNELQGYHHYNLILPTRRDMDLTDLHNISNYLHDLKEPIDILINNAGINIINNVEAITQEAINAMLTVNLSAPLALMQACVPHMKAQRWGRIVNISSIWGVRSKEFRTLYSATKFGLNGITKALSRELGEYNILVNAVCPGYVNTELTNKNVPPDEQERIKATIPLRRFAEPEEIAKVIKFLISDENTYITGQTIIIDGGFLA